MSQKKAENIFRYDFRSSSITVCSLYIYLAEFNEIQITTCNFQYRHISIFKIFRSCHSVLLLILYLIASTKISGDVHIIVLMCHYRDNSERDESGEYDDRAIGPPLSIQFLEYFLF